MKREKKRSVFEIDIPGDELTSIDVRGDGLPTIERSRRTPMGMAVQENLVSLDERSALEEKISKENAELAKEFVRLKNEGLITDLIPLDKIHTNKLIRDRNIIADDDLEELKKSIREIGLSNPIRVEKISEDQFELIQGFRRLAAFKAIHDESTTKLEQGRWAKIPAAFFPSHDDLATFYRQMVDENMVRKDVSFAEMAGLALKFSADAETGQNDLDAAVTTLYRTASYSKRSNIRAFAQLLTAIGDVLKWPECIPRNLGLEVRRRLESAPKEVSQLKTALETVSEQKEELRILHAFAKGRLEGESEDDQTHPGEVCLEIDHGSGTARCIFKGRRLEIKNSREFNNLDESSLRKGLDVFFEIFNGKR